MFFSAPAVKFLCGVVFNHFQPAIKKSSGYAVNVNATGFNHNATKMAKLKIG